ncbi:MAG: C40 family peptidase [Polaribacter sp.]|nr:C40 family peptidase [Polaribacter sp.]MDG1810412.1 C40 family peptidase [Polaribacter sp.]MDG1993397.1 C40 family peptidase [Polaribacter sp.]
MLYGICNLSIVPLRLETSDNSEMVSQVLFGEHFKVLDKKKNWSKIRIHFDGCEGYINNKQFFEISEENYLELSNSNTTLSGELIDFLIEENGQLSTIPIGATLPFYHNKKVSIGAKKFTFEGTIINKKLDKELLLKTAFLFLNTPHFWGGKTPFGIDSAGFTQMVYKLCGYQLLRKAKQQATQGEVLSFIEESEPGDLAFFDDNEGVITHVGIIMKDNHIIHAYGKVRIDRLDHSGIYNVDTKKHTHKLRVIKKII